MPAVSPIQSNFNSGEFSPLMEGRVDFERYKTALRVCKNHIPLLQGPLARRPGTYVCDEVKDSTKATRTVRFKFSTVSAFAIEFGDLYVRFKKDRAPIYDLTLTITGITKANPGVLTYTGTDPSNGDHVDLSGVVGMTEVNGRRFTVSNVNAGANTFELQTVAGVNVDTSAFGTWSSGGIVSRVYTLTTTYLEADLFQLKFVQSADVLWIFHPDYPERQLARVSDSSWTITDTVYLDGPYLTQNNTTTTLTPGAATGTNILVTASAVTGINNDQGFLATDVGRLIRIQQGSVWGYCRIVTFNTATTVHVDIINTLTSTAAKLVWRLGVFGATNGYPACGTFYGDRLYRGGVPEIPERIDGSQIGDYSNMAPSAIDGTVTDSSAVSFRLNSNDVQTIRWMLGTANGIAIGTAEGEWLVTPSTLNEALTPTNINAKQSTSWGSADTMAIQAGTALLYVEQGARRVREMNYLYYENVLQSSDATVLAEHITKGNYDPASPGTGASTIASSGLVEIAYQRKTQPIIWGVRNDGALVGLLYSKDDKVIGWHRHLLGGWSDAAHTIPAQVESCCVIPSSDGSYDELWMIVRRYINGRSVRMNELLTAIWQQGDPQEDGYFVDGGLTYDGTPTTIITGLFHLAGETVQLCVDGATHPDVVVSATGSITLNYAASVVHVGYTYQSDAACLRFDAGSATGTAQGKIQRMHAVGFRLYDTLGLEVGDAFDNLRPIEFRTAADPMSQAVPLFTGDKTSADFSWDGDYEKGALVCWRFATPLPGTVVAVMPQLVTQDGG